MPPEWSDTSVIAAAWDSLKQAASDHYVPGSFTTFLSYEWTAMPKGRNLHRNVLFSTLAAPLPFGAAQSTDPEDQWSWMEGIRATGTDVFAIPHNGNLSDGLIYAMTNSAGAAMDAARRARNEPLTEIAQIKVQSETVPALSPDDAFAAFEVYDRRLASGVLKSRFDGPVSGRPMDAGWRYWPEPGSIPVTMALSAGRTCTAA